MLLRLWPEKTTVSFMSLRFIALIISVVALLASAALLGTRGLNLGIDFAGGAVIEVDKPEDVSADQIRNTVTNLVTGDVQVNSARNRRLAMKRQMRHRTGLAMWSAGPCVT